MVQLAYSECQNRDIKKPLPKKPPHNPHTEHPPACVCLTHGGRETRNETMELAVCS